MITYPDLDSQTHGYISMCFFVLVNYFNFLQPNTEAAAAILRISTFHRM